MRKFSVNAKEYKKLLMIQWIIQLGLIALSVYSTSNFLIGCSILEAILLISKKECCRYLNKSELQQIRAGYKMGLLLIGVALAIVAVSLVDFLIVKNRVEYLVIWIVCGVSLIQVGLSIVLLVQSRVKLYFNKILGIMDVALILIYFLVIISSLLEANALSNSDQMSLISAFVFALIIVLAASMMIFCAICKKKTVRESWSVANQYYQNKKRFFHYIFVGKDGISAVIKFILSIISTSLFMFANALFSCSLGIARYNVLRMQGKSKQEKLKIF
ncbi:MAG: hypothetical protein ACK5LZ_02245 [Anaerorhabdus sp.]